MEKIKVLCLILEIVAIGFVASSMILPWWTLRITSEARTILEKDFTVEFSLSKTVTGASNANNQSATVALASLLPSDSQGTLGFMDVTLWLAIIALVLTIPVVMVTVFRKTSRYVRYATILGFLSVMVLFVSTAYFVAELPASIASVSTLTPIDVPHRWPSIQASDIASAWGSKVAPAGSPISGWLPQASFWVWQPGAGWYLAFSAVFLILTATMILRLTIERRQEI